MGVLESSGEDLDFCVSKRVGTLDIDHVVGPSVHLYARCARSDFSKIESRSSMKFGNDDQQLCRMSMLTFGRSRPATVQGHLLRERQCKMYPQLSINIRALAHSRLSTI